MYGEANSSPLSQIATPVRAFPKSTPKIIIWPGCGRCTAWERDAVPPEVRHIVDGFPAQVAILGLQDAHTGVAKHHAFPQPFNGAVLHSGIQVADNPAGWRPPRFSGVLFDNLIDCAADPPVHRSPAGKAQIRGAVPVMATSGYFTAISERSWFSISPHRSPTDRPWSDGRSWN